MKTNVTARNLELTERLRARIERKLRRLDRLAHPLAQANVEIIAKASHSSEQSHVAEVTLESNGSILRSTSAGATAVAAFDVVIDKLERQMVRTKERPRSVRLRDMAAPHEALARAGEGTTDGVPDEEEPGPRVVKLKRFDMTPMFPEDAITQLEELGHDFFVFLSAETDQIAVLYRRVDGDYGLIEPVLERRGKRG